MQWLSPRALSFNPMPELQEETSDSVDFEADAEALPVKNNSATSQRTDGLRGQALILTMMVSGGVTLPTLCVSTTTR